MFRQDFTCPALLEDGFRPYPYGAVTRYGRSFQIVPVLLEAAAGLVRFRSPLLSESLLMSFPPGTEMFQFPGFASNPLWIQGQILRIRRQKTEDGRQAEPCRSKAPSVVCRLTSVVWKWVSPFGNPRIKACSQLPTAYRSVPRPSSPARAKASTERP